MSASALGPVLEGALGKWAGEGVRGVWMDVELGQSDWVPVLAGAGFTFHHARDRLVTMVTRDDLPTNVPQQRLWFIYDYQGRRIFKSYAEREDGLWTEKRIHTFHYDGWNLIQENIHNISPTNTTNELRTYTQLDEWTAAMAAVDFGLKLAELFDEQEELMEQQGKIDKKNQEVQELLEKLKTAAEKQQDAEDLLQELSDALNGEGGYGDSIQEVEDQIKSSSNQIRQAARQAAKEAKEESEGADALMEFFGTEPGSLKRMDATARMELANRIRKNRDLRELADKVGRFVRLAMAEQAQKIVHGVDEVHDVEMGDDIHRVLPSELMYLASEETEDLIFLKFAEKGLLQYKLRGTEKVARGAIICMIDSSGSMYGAKDTWARAVGIALLHIAHKQGRDFYGIIFSSGYDRLLEFEFPKGVAKPSEVLDFAEAGYHGGTDFMLPINRSVEVLERQYDDDNAQKGDLVMVTDGEAPVNPEWLDRYVNKKEMLGFRLYSCLIGVHSDTLNAISDHIYNITEFAHGSDVQDMFGYV